jgi:hypothetical protein
MTSIKNHKNPEFCKKARELMLKLQIIEARVVVDFLFQSTMNALLFIFWVNISLFSDELVLKD